MTSRSSSPRGSQRRLSPALTSRSRRSADHARGVSLAEADETPTAVSATDASNVTHKGPKTRRIGRV
jgi:hypothetical protein